MKKILFICNSHFDLYKIFQKGIEEHTEYEVTTIPILYKEFEYKNVTQRIYNFFSKYFLGKNLKSIWVSKDRIRGLSKKDRFEYTFIICPELLHPVHLKFLKTISKKMIVYYWDGFDHFPAYRDTVAYFDECYSFDPIDVKQYNLKFITNFYFVEDRNNETKTDFFFLSSYDSRYPLLEKIVSLLERQNKKMLVYQYTKDPGILAGNTNKSIQFINKHIPPNEVTQFMKETRIILDIQKTIQHGLSFRVFEAMGLRKKLITTNKDIVNYDFFNPNNIFIWEEDTESIPDTFLNTPYQELPDNIYKKYSRENWIKKVFDL